MGAVETYNTSGQLTAMANSMGETTSYIYNTDDQLETITGHYGHTIGFTYVDNMIDTVTDPSGEVYRYGYDSLDRLVSVTYPDETPNDDSDNPVRTYHYEDDPYVHYLTGITDENRRSLRDLGI